MAIPVARGLFTRTLPRRRLSSDAAAELLRQPTDVFRAVTTRPDSKLQRWTIGPGQTIEVAQTLDRHTLRIKNVGLVDVRYAHHEEEAESTADFAELLVGEMQKFDIHYSAVQDYREGIKKIIFHCEWGDAMWIHNPDAVSDATVEVFEVY